MGERVVVTGGAGFIGSHVADALIARGDEVHIIDDLSNGKRANLGDGATFHELDVADVAGVRALREQIGPIDRWFHLAAQVDVQVSVEDPALDARVNVIGTIAVLSAAAVDGAPVTLASTGGAIYGDAEPPALETTPSRPVSGYGAAKFAAEAYLAQDARLRGSRHSIVRYANVYGPRQDPYGEGGVVAIFGNRALEGRPARIFGDGTQTRDFVYVGDVAAATIAASDLAVAGGDATLRADGDLPMYNVGTGLETNLLELWDAVRRAVGSDLPIEFEPAKPGEVYRSALDSELARATLGVAIDTSVDDGVAATLAWLGEQRPAGTQATA